MPTKFCPHCGKRTGFQVKFNIVCQIGDEKEKGFLRICKECGGRFITIQKDERINMKTQEEIHEIELEVQGMT